MHGKRGVDAGAVDALALLVQVAHGGAHALGSHQHDVDVLAEVHAVVLHHTQQEPVGQAQGGAGLHGRQDAGVQAGLGGVGNQQNDHVRLGNDVKHLAQGAVRLVEAHGAGLVAGGGVGAQANGDLDVGASLGEGVAQVLGLSGGLGAPADDADLLDVLESLGKEGVLVAATPARQAKSRFGWAASTGGS